MPGRTVRCLVLVPCALLAAACGDAAVQSSGTAGSAVQAPVASGLGSNEQLAPVPAPKAAASDHGAAPASVPVSLGTAQGRVERSVSARYVVPHGGFLTAFDAVVTRATALGGYVVDSSTTPDSAGRISSGAVTVKVPSAHLSDLIGGLPSDFTVSALDYGSQDHTAETVDLGARLAASIAHRTALERLRDRTGSIAEVASLEQQIAQVQLEVDQEQGALNAVNARVDLATASIALTEKDARPAAAPPGHTDPALVRALRTGAENALQLVAGAVLVGVSVLPVAVLAAAAWMVRRRLHRPDLRPPTA